MSTAGHPHISKKIFGPLTFGILLILTLAFFAFVFHHFSVSVWVYLKFLASLFLIVHIPGQALINLSRLKVNRPEGVPIAWAMGMVSSTVIYKFSRLVHLEWIFFLWVGAALVSFVFFLVKRPPSKESFSFETNWAGAGFIALCLLTFGILFFDNYRNGISQPDGSLLVNMHYYDGFIRNSVIREVSHSVPPEMPFASGFSLNYHYGMDLFISIFYRYLHIGVFDLNHRLVITFFFALLLLSAFSFLREFFASSAAALYGTFLLLFGSGGLSYLASFFLGAPQGGNIFFNFYLHELLNANSFLPALAVLFSGFLCLTRYLRTRSTAFLIFSAFLLAFVLEFKVFFIAPIAGGLFLSGIYLFVRRRDSSLLKAFGLTAAISLPLLAVAILGYGGGVPYNFRVKVVDWIFHSLRELRLEAFLNAWKGITQQYLFSLSNIFLSLISVLIFVLGSLGLGLLCLPKLARDLFSIKKGDEVRLFLKAFMGIALAYFFGFSVSLKNLPRNIVNIYVYYLGLIILSIFLADWVIGSPAKKKRRGKILALAAVAALSIPNTVRYLSIKVHLPEPRLFSASFLEAADWVIHNTSPQTVILQPLDLRYVCYFADRRVVLDNSIHSYLPFHLQLSVIKSRERDIARFFEDPARSADVLKKYAVSFVWAGREKGLQPGQNPCPFELVSYNDIGTKKIRKFVKSHLLTRIFWNKDYCFYRAKEFDDKDKEIFVLEESGGESRFKKFE